MFTDHDPPLYVRAPHPLWWEVLRHSWSAPRNRALVLRDRSGGFHRAGAGQGAPGPAGGRYAGSPAARLRLRDCDQAFHVQLDQRSGTRTVGLPTGRGTESTDVRVLWWADDPAQVVRSGTLYGWHPVRKELERCLGVIGGEYANVGKRITGDVLLQYLGGPRRLPDHGLAFRVTEILTREDAEELRLGEPAEGGAPYPWTDTREEYEFCKQAVQEGPVSLAALWLVRHPEQVSQVLDWAVGHADLIRGETTWQDQLALLLGKLTAQEQQELSLLLRDRLSALGRPVPGPTATPTGRPAGRTTGPPYAGEPGGGWTASGANGMRSANGANGRPVGDRLNGVPR
ncbi:hypothetical protein ACIQF6_34385 [Kitasatospora sp. NPDC092948]|uniref:hypothetical protein n=1 Tax=Kitasatospora sp. NPDC092948 TaxID=3364088 RepID=UPI0038060918